MNNNKTILPKLSLPTVGSQKNLILLSLLCVLLCASLFVANVEAQNTIPADTEQTIRDIISAALDNPIVFLKENVPIYIGAVISAWCAIFLYAWKIILWILKPIIS